MFCVDKIEKNYTDIPNANIWCLFVQRFEEKEIPIAKSCSIEHFILLIPAGQFPLTSQNTGMKLHVLQYTMNIESIPNGSLLDEKLHVPSKSYLLKL